MPLDPWIIEKIKEREEQQPVEEIDIPLERPERDDSPKPGHEMPIPNETVPAPEKKDDEPKRGVDISRITGSDDDEEAGAAVVDIGKLPKLPPEEPVKKESPEKKPD